MILWHSTEDTPRIPEIVPAHQPVQIWIGTYPIEPGQDVAVSWDVINSGVKKESNTVPAHWHHNEDQRSNSYWVAELGPFERGSLVEYTISGADTHGTIEEQIFQFTVATPTAMENELMNDILR